MEMDSLVVSENKDENPISCDIYVGQLRSEMVTQFNRVLCSEGNDMYGNQNEC